MLTRSIVLAAVSVIGVSGISISVGVAIHRIETRARNQVYRLADSLADKRADSVRQVLTRELRVVRDSLHTQSTKVTAQAGTVRQRIQQLTSQHRVQPDVAAMVQATEVLLDDAERLRVLAVRQTVTTDIVLGHDSTMIRALQVQVAQSHVRIVQLEQRPSRVRAWLGHGVALVSGVLIGRVMAQPP